MRASLEIGPIFFLNTTISPSLNLFRFPDPICKCLKSLSANFWMQISECRLGCTVVCGRQKNGACQGGGAGEERAATNYGEIRALGAVDEGCSSLGFCPLGEANSFFSRQGCTWASRFASAQQQSTSKHVMNEFQ